MLQEWIRGVVDDPGTETGSKSKWGRYILAILICVGILALIWPMGKEKPAQVTAPSTIGGVEQGQQKITRQLEGILSQVEGAGKVSVSITLRSDGLKSYASNTKNDVRETDEQDSSGGDRKIREENNSKEIVVNGGSALLVEETAPQITGVLIVATGAKDPAIKEELSDAAAALLNISPHQIRVLPRKEG